MMMMIVLFIFKLLLKRFVGVGGRAKTVQEQGQVIF